MRIPEIHAPDSLKSNSPEATRPSFGRKREQEGRHTRRIARTNQRDNPRKCRRRQTLAFTIDTNSDWTVSLPAGCDWITPSKTSGRAGKEKISFTAALNQTGAEREARITVTAGALSRYTTVRRDGTVFSVSENGKPISKLTFAASDAAGLSTELTVGCIESWTLTAKPQWLTVTPSSGDAGETKVTLTAEVNTEAAREDYITITTAHGLVLTAPVLQLSDRPEPDSKAVGFVYYNDDFSRVKGGADG